MDMTVELSSSSPQGAEPLLYCLCGFCLSYFYT
jgi:hypothetical protein